MWKDLRSAKVSQILEISEGTVKSRLARGRDSLTDIYDLRKRRANI
ncbi:hypothetical protein NE634_16210 [Lacrimispora saccharolytica]|nr:hypothetical protein [Lacrimispora saccharolytica]